MILNETVETRETRTLGEERSETHLTRWRGSITWTEIQALVEAHLINKLGRGHRHGLTTKLFLPSGVMVVYGDISFEIVRDHDWFMKEPADAATQD